MTRSATPIQLAIRLARVLVLTCVAGLAASCDSTPQLARLSADAVVLAFGDSLTFGTGAAREQSYPARLAAAIGRRVVNAGVPGETTPEALKRLPGVLEASVPTLVILCHGGNDFIRKLDRARTEQNLRDMVGIARQSGASVVLIGVPSPGLFLSSEALYERVAEDLGLPIEDEILPELLGDNSYKSDAIHPNAAGYGRMADAVRQVLEDAGAI